jgi:hypothetical protein
MLSNLSELLRGDMECPYHTRTYQVMDVQRRQGIQIAYHCHYPKEHEIVPPYLRPWHFVHVRLRAADSDPCVQLFMA